MAKLLEKSNENNFKKIIKGSGISIIITLILLIIFSILLTYTSISETTIPAVTIITTLISILIGSSLSMAEIRKSGITNGAIIGLIYIAVIYLLSSVIERDFSINTYSIIMILGSVLAGALGGIIGVNKK